MSIDALQAQISSLQEQQLTEQLTQHLAPGIDIPTATSVINLSSDRLLSHIQIVTSPEGSPWLSGHVLGLRQQWLRADVGLAICDYQVYSHRISRPTHGLWNNTYTPPAEFGIEGRREIPFEANNPILLDNAAGELADQIAGLAGMSTFDNVTIRLLTGANPQLSNFVPRFLEERGVAMFVNDGQDYGFRIKALGQRV